MNRLPTKELKTFDNFDFSLLKGKDVERLKALPSLAAIYSHRMIFTSNKNPALWREDFDEDATLLCALDRIFDDATVFKLRGESFRGKKLETVSLQTGKVRAVEPLNEPTE